MSHLIAAIGLRLVIAAIIYLVTVAIWIGRTSGWAALGLFGASIIFGGFAGIALIAAMTIVRHIDSPTLRLLVHPPLTVLLFAALGYVIAGVLMGMHNDVARDMARFVGLMAAIAVVDAVLGHALDRWIARRQVHAGS